MLTLYTRHALINIYTLEYIYIYYVYYKMYRYGKVGRKFTILQLLLINVYVNVMMSIPASGIAKIRKTTSILQVVVEIFT